MKILEIIGALSRVGGYLMNPVTTKGISQTAKLSKDTLPFKNAAKATKAGEKAAKNMRKVIPFASKGGWIEKTLTKSFVNRNLKALNAAKAEIARNGTQVFGDTIFKLFWAANIWDAVTDYYAAKQILLENPPPDADAQLKKLQGQFMAQVLLPGIAMGGAKLLGMIPNALASVAKSSPGTTLPKLGMTINVATDFIVRAGAAGALAVFMTDEGKQKISEWLGGVIDGLGFVSSPLFTLLEYAVPALEMATGMKAPQVVKNFVAQPKAPAAGAQGGSDQSGVAGSVLGALAGGGTLDDIAATKFADMVTKK